MSPDSLFQQVLAAHGGSERWRRVKELHIDVRCGGAALLARFQKNAYRRYRAVVNTRNPRVRFSPFKGKHGVYTPERVWIETDQGQICQARNNPRNFFPSWRRYIFWDALDVLYFGGYAMWNYLCAPFCWQGEGIDIQAGAPWQEAGETWQSLTVRFPPGWPTHSSKQVFYINARGYIRRHDYPARVIGSFARAAHYSDHHQVVDGLVFPTRRRVFPRRGDNRAMSFPTLIWIDIDHIEVVRD